MAYLHWSIPKYRPTTKMCVLSNRNSNLTEHLLFLFVKSGNPVWRIMPAISAQSYFSHSWTGVLQWIHLSKHEPYLCQLVQIMVQKSRCWNEIFGIKAFASQLAKTTPSLVYMGYWESLICSNDATIKISMIINWEGIQLGGVEQWLVKCLISQSFETFKTSNYKDCEIG